ncbi:MAG: FtsH protease activity modulator HflK [Pseudomonadota bacterium]
MPWDDDTQPKKGPTRRKNPWDTHAKPGQSDAPRGAGPSRPGAEQDDIYAMLKRAQENFRKGGNGNGDGGGNGPVGDFFRWSGPLGGIGMIVVVVLLLWLASGFYLVQPNEQAVVVTFGKYTRSDELPGLKYRLPLPLQSHQIVDVTTERRIEVGYRGDGSGRGVTRISATDIPDESLMLTGDENIIDIDYVVLWRVSNARDYLYSIRNPEDTIKIVAESAMREVIGRTKIQLALTEARSQIQSDTRVLMQKMLDEYKAGVTINNIQLQKVDPPGPVIDAFNDVQRARQEREQSRNQAEAYRNDILPRARGESEKLRQQAEAYKQEVMDRATGDASRFNAIYKAYQNAKDVTAQRMYLETMEQVILNAQTIILDDKGGGALPYLSLNEMRRPPASNAPAAAAAP